MAQRPSSTLRKQHFWTVGRRFFFASYHSGHGHYTGRRRPSVSVELKHQTKAADVVIQFVLTRANGATL